MSTISGTIADTITLASTGTYGSPLTLSDTGFVGNGGTAIFGPNTQAWSVANYGTIDGAIKFLKGGSVTNASGGTISGGGASGVNIAGGDGMVSNAGAISGFDGVNLYAGGIITNAASGFIGGGGFYAILINAGTSSVTNFGTVSGNVGGAELGGGGALVNSGGTIQGSGGAGVRIDNDGTVANLAGLISGGSYGAYLGVGAGSLFNDAGAVINGLIDGVKQTDVQNSGWTVSNTGTITGGRTAGVYFYRGGSLINNAGGVISGGSYGVEIRNAAGTVVDAGTIVGASGTAVRFDGTGANRLILDPGAVLIGSAIGSTATASDHGIVTRATNTLELAASGSAGTLTGLGTSFVNFGTVSVGSGAEWVLSGNNTIASGTTLIDSGTLVNAGTLVFAGALVPQGGTLENTGTILKDVYVSGGLAIIVNSGVIDNAGQPAVFLLNGGTVANAAGGVISGGGINFGAIAAYNSAATITNSGSIDGGALGIHLQMGGNVTNVGGLITGAAGIYSDQGGSFINTSDGVISASGYAIDVQQLNLAFTGIGTVINAGTIIANVGVMLKNGGTVIDSGTISGASDAIAFGRAGAFGPRDDGLLVLEEGYKLIGAVLGYASPTVTNTVELRGGAGAVNVNFNGLTLSNFGTVAFGAASGNSETLTIANTAALPGEIAAFNQFHDIIDLTQINPTGATATLGAGNHLIVSNGGQSVSLQLDNGDYSGVQWQTSPDGTGGTDVAVACYCRGTLILTEGGEVPVEELRIDHLVVTLSGVLRPIRWIGRRGYQGRFVAGNKNVLPICVMAGALGAGIPARDLWVSPEHSLYIDDVLVQAKHLINGFTVVQADSVDDVAYFHIELAAHDVIYADGAPAETFVDCDNRLMFANGAEYQRLYPEDDRPQWQFCAPRLEWGSAALIAIRKRLLDRVRQAGAPDASDPGLHLLLNGDALTPVSVVGSTYRFQLPAERGRVWLGSHRFVPAERDAASRDIRCLGVPLERIVLADADLSIEAWHSHPAFRDGFHADEISHRWTDGNAEIPAPLLRPFAGPITLEVHLRNDPRSVPKDHRAA